MFNPYNKDSQPFSWAWQNQKMWADAWAPIHDLLKPPPAPTKRPVPVAIPVASPAPTVRPAGPLLTRDQVAALMAAPLTQAQRDHIAEADARVAAIEREKDRSAALWIAALVVLVLFLVLRWH